MLLRIQESLCVILFIFYHTCRIAKEVSDKHLLHTICFIIPLFGASHSNMQGNHYHLNVML